MKLYIALFTAFVCLSVSAPAQTSSKSTKTTTQSANRIKQAVPGVTQSMTGCVDQQNGHYVIRDAKTDQLLNLQAPGPDADNYFARFVGHEVKVSGTQSSDTLKITQIGQVADMCGTAK